MERRAVSELTDALWRRYREQGDMGARARLLDGYIGLVYHAAHEMRRPGPAEPDLDDLIGAGALGLMQALEGFDPGRGLAFSTYAMPRIRGAMLDEIQSREWSPRSVRVRRRLLAQSRAELQQRLGRAPDPHQVAERMGIDLETYWKWQNASEGRTMIALDASRPDAEDSTLAEKIPDARVSAPGEALMEAETLEGLRAAIERLPAKDRLVLTLYYYEGLTLKLIGDVLHVSESRVSQIHSRALRRLREWVEA